MANDSPPKVAKVAPPGHVGGAEGSVERALQTEQKKLALVQEVSRALSSGLDLDKLLVLIMEKVTLLMEADRSTLYLLSEDRTELWSKVLQGGAMQEIRLRVGEGIAGWVAASGETVNIPDAYIDKRFQPAVDLRSGYRTTSILCAPMCNSLGTIVGVAQVLNKKGGPFTKDDEQLLAALSSQAAVSIENSKLYHSVVAKNVELLEAQEKLQQKTYELNLLFEIEREMNIAHSLDDLLARILHRAIDMVGAEAGSIALRDPESDELRFRTIAGPEVQKLEHKSIKIGDGLIGWVAAQREPVICNDPASDPRHARDFVSELGLSPKHLLCVPLIADEVVGVIELIDKAETDDVTAPNTGFEEGDLKLMVLIAGQASKAIQMARVEHERTNQDRLASIGQMLAGVLHDLKTPMTIISGYAQLMAQIPEAEQREAYVEQILRQFDLMGGMTREVLAFARGEANILVRKVYLHKFLEEVATQLAHSLAGRRVQMKITPTYNGTAYFDEQKMMRLIHNLARNAADAMPEGGELRITTTTESDDLCFELEDTGHGIPAQLEGRLFDMFATAKEGGTGLGLAIVKKIVDEHGGSIHYDSGPNGTRFRILLPLEKPVGDKDAAPADVVPITG